MNSDTPEPLESGSTVPSTRLQPPHVGVNPSAANARQTLRSADLLAGANAVEIEHLGQTYRLQTTRAGKLILTK